MLQNAYLLAKIGVDTAENGRNLPKILPKFCPGGSSSTGRSAPWPRFEQHLNLDVTESDLRLAKLADFAIFKTNFANFWRARSRLYQNEILQENMRLTAVFKLYKICILLHRCKSQFFRKKSV